MRIDLKDKTVGELEKIVVEMGQRKFLGGYIFRFIHAQNVSEISEITPLSKSFRDKLVEHGYFISHIIIKDKQIEGSRVRIRIK